MTPVATTRRLKMKASKRALKMLADQAMGNDLLKGFIELITNSDETYARIENTGISASGKIEVEVDRRPRKKQTVIRVIDYGEGMDELQLERCVGSYGEDTSGQIGRGIFGMGLKDTVNAFGEGKITSFRNGKKYCCTLRNIEELEIESAKLINKADKSQFRNCPQGTTVEVLVLNPKVRIPLIDSLRQQLQTHVCLRGIMTDPTRTIILRDLRTGTADELRYSTPEGEVLLDKAVLKLPDYPELEPRLTVKRATGADALSQSGSYRTGGILITSRRTCHEATLFGFDDDPHAGKLFGELRCDELYDWQAAGDPVVDKNRSGLRKDHPLTKALLDAARLEIQKIVTAEKEKERRQRKNLEQEETQKRFKELVSRLNEIAKNELQIGGTGTGSGTTVPPEARAPQDGLEFIPDTYRIILAEKEFLKLRVQVDGTTGIAVGDRIEISCDNPYIRILDDRPVVPKLYCDDPPLSLVRVPVEGLQPNSQAFVTAKTGSKAALAAVEVVSMKAQKQHHPSGGLFREIKYEERPDLPVRARFDRKEGTIWVNTMGRSVDLYFGPGGEGQEQPTNQLLVAELVTELSCQEIARVKRETKILDIPPGVDELEATFSHIIKLKADYAPLIHKILVNQENRRRTQY